jgi:hypothetical protein
MRVESKVVHITVPMSIKNLVARLKLVMIYDSEGLLKPSFRNYVIIISTEKYSLISFRDPFQPHLMTFPVGQMNVDRIHNIHRPIM